MSSACPSPMHPTGAELAYDDWYSINEAAATCNVSRDTIKRRLRKGNLPGARRGYGAGPGGPWLIPAADLQAIGVLKDGTTSGQTVPADANHDHELATLRRRLAAAEATITAQRAHLQDLRGIPPLTGPPGDTHV